MSRCIRLKRRLSAIKIEILVFLVWLEKYLPGVVMETVLRMTEGLIKGSFSLGRGCKDQIFIFKQWGEKARDKKLY